MENSEQVQALATLPPDLAIIKLENETIQSLAAAHPRDHLKIRQSLVEQIEAYPSFARTAIYSKPVGKDNDGVMKYARGLSIRAAEAIAEAYGFCRVRSDVSPIDDTTVKVEATFTDYQNGRIWQDGGILSKFYKNRFGKMTRIPDDRFYNVTVKAEASKRIREVILRSVPPGLRSELTELVEEQIENLLDDTTIQKIIANFANKNIPVEILEKRIGKTIKTGWTIEDRKNLLGLWNSLEQEETTVQEIIDGDVLENNKKLIDGPVSSKDFEPEERSPETQAKIDKQKEDLQNSQPKQRKTRSDKGKPRKPKVSGRAEYHCNSCTRDFGNPAQHNETTGDNQCPFCLKWDTKKNE